ncbi:hypothetical protein H4219_004678 [Mycoemilia scoparia]|uniref:Kinesin motor domain-containing protein n=1 Tax=Mycoemilia scoparia TaxID=417184 RepID=A0A9W8DQY5_9FUNG|nr:hypothetical protein H4219_004678 [Mycoemilia scoparia]
MVYAHPHHQGQQKIKVLCRVRPFLAHETPDGSVQVEEDQKVLRATNLRDPEKDIRYTFDACYGDEVSQETVYNNDVKPLIENVFNGLDTTIFCYGVTGAGKTHTIQGNENEPGIIPRAFKQIFQLAHNNVSPTGDGDGGCEIKVSYYEIYKEAVFDLFKPDLTTAHTATDPSATASASATTSTTTSTVVQPSGLPIREDVNRKIFIAGLSEKVVTTYDQFISLYTTACKYRRTGSTKLNSHSSRSHAILTVQVTTTTTQGKVHLIDLAGSEDNRKTDNKGRHRMAESSAINRSLFVLGQVVEALNSGAHRIPYRDSKMTRILQDSLGGRCVGMMIVNVAPGKAFLQDTHNTLNFATKSRDVVNKPVVNEIVDQRWSVAAERLYGGGVRGGGGGGNLGRPQRNLAGGVVRPAHNQSRLRNSPHCGTDGKVLAGSHNTISSCNGKSFSGTTVAGGQSRVTRLNSSNSSAATSHNNNNNSNAVRGRSRGGIDMVYAPDQRQIEELVSKKLQDIHKKSSLELDERLSQLEKRIDRRVSDNEVIDLLSPTTKLKNSKAWLSQARKFEKEGKLREALTRYEHARQYAPNLRKLEAHISKLKKRIAAKSQSSSDGVDHGRSGSAANAKLAPDNGTGKTKKIKKRQQRSENHAASLQHRQGGSGGIGNDFDDDDDGLSEFTDEDGDDSGIGGSLSDPESPGAEKAHRIIKNKLLKDTVAPANSGHQPMVLNLGGYHPSQQQKISESKPNNKKRRRSLSSTENNIPGGGANADQDNRNDDSDSGTVVVAKKPKNSNTGGQTGSTSLFNSISLSFKPRTTTTTSSTTTASGDLKLSQALKAKADRRLSKSKKLKEAKMRMKNNKDQKKKVRLENKSKTSTTTALAMLEAETPNMFRVPSELDLENSPNLRNMKHLMAKKLEFKPKDGKSQETRNRRRLNKPQRAIDNSSSSSSVTNKLLLQKKNKSTKMSTAMDISDLDSDGDDNDDDDDGGSIYCPDLQSPMVPPVLSKPSSQLNGVGKSKSKSSKNILLDFEYEYQDAEIDPDELDGIDSSKNNKTKKKRKLKLNGNSSSNLGIDSSINAAITTTSSTLGSFLSDTPVKESKAATSSSNVGDDSSSLCEILKVINSRQVKMITRLKGIGKRRAEQIDQYVQYNGPMSNVDDLRNLTGFSDALISNIKTSVI